MRNLDIIALLFLGSPEGPDTTNTKDAKNTIISAQNTEMRQDIDTIKILIKELTDKLQTKKDTTK